MKQLIMANELGYKAFVVALNTDDFDVKTQYPELRESVTSPKQLKIKTTTDVVIKINSTDNDPIEVKSTDNYFEFTISEITNIYITTTTEATIGLSLLG